MSTFGFNVGVTVSLGDMELALDYLNNKDLFEDNINTENRFNSLTDNHVDLASTTEISGEDEDDYFEGSCEDEDDSEELDESNFEEDDDSYFADSEELDDSEESCESTEDDEDDYFDEDDTELEAAEAEILVDSTPKSTIKSNTKTDTELEEIKHKLDTLNRQKEAARQLEIKRLQLEAQKAERELAELEKRNKLALQTQMKRSTNELKNTTSMQKEKQPISNIKNEAPVQKQIHTITKEQMYSNMEIDALYNEVKKYLSSRGVKKVAISKEELEKEFGKSNISKLIIKSYLILIGKGVTIGK